MGSAETGGTNSLHEDEFFDQWRSKTTLWHSLSKLLLLFFLLLAVYSNEVAWNVFHLPCLKGALDELENADPSANVQTRPCERQGARGSLSISPVVDIVCLYKLVPGIAHHSYGFNCASLSIPHIFCSFWILRASADMHKKRLPCSPHPGHSSVGGFERGDPSCKAGGQLFRSAQGIALGVIRVH